MPRKHVAGAREETAHERIIRLEVEGLGHDLATLAAAGRKRAVKLMGKAELDEDQQEELDGIIADHHEDRAAKRFVARAVDKADRRWLKRAGTRWHRALTARLLERARYYDDSVTSLGPDGGRAAYLLETMADAHDRFHERARKAEKRAERARNDLEATSNSTAPSSDGDPSTPKVPPPSFEELAAAAPGARRRRRKPRVGLVGYITLDPDSE